ncbi:MAG TPA: hypothetical protein VFG51_00475 [Candidatus Saccharimonadia bacterium]|nr:hypothetical protein [Candidatus Saccharimonadia bacterium]
MPTLRRELPQKSFIDEAKRWAADTEKIWQTANTKERTALLFAYIANLFSLAGIATGSVLMIDFVQRVSRSYEAFIKLNPNMGETLRMQEFQSFVSWPDSPYKVLLFSLLALPITALFIDVLRTYALAKTVKKQDFGAGNRYGRTRDDR